jgi:septal ring factor EnvC (AmiA/AmiB activator)
MEGGEMSDTPISDSTPHNVADLGMRIRMIERELNAANAIIRQQQLLDEDNLRLQERIKRLEEELNELRSDESRLLNSNGELERRIKLLEEAGDLMVQHFYTDEPRSEMWEKAKEAKP